MSDLAKRLKDSVLYVTKDWAKQRKAEERHTSALANRRARLVRASDYYNFKSAAEEVMEQAYMAASANGTLPASARQVMYQARPFIQDMMGGRPLTISIFAKPYYPITWRSMGSIGISPTTIVDISPSRTQNIRSGSAPSVHANISKASANQCLIPRLCPRARHHAGPR